MVITADAKKVTVSCACERTAPRPTLSLEACHVAFDCGRLEADFKVLVGHESGADRGDEFVGGSLCQGGRFGR